MTDTNELPQLLDDPEEEHAVTADIVDAVMGRLDSIDPDADEFDVGFTADTIRAAIERKYGDA